VTAKRSTLIASCLNLLLSRADLYPKSPGRHAPYYLQFAADSKGNGI
jgi:hypothetical protein